MSTRSTTHFRYGGKAEAKIYKHPDGYPSAMRQAFDEFFATVEAHTQDTRYSDPCYLAAKWVTYLVHYYCAGPERKPCYEEEPTAASAWPSTWLDFLSVGVVMEDPGDIEYRYLVECDQIQADGRPKVICEERLYDEKWQGVRWKVCHEEGF